MASTACGFLPGQVRGPARHDSVGGPAGVVRVGAEGMRVEPEDRLTLPERQLAHLPPSAVSGGPADPHVRGRYVPRPTVMTTFPFLCPLSTYRWASTI